MQISTGFPNFPIMFILTVILKELKMVKKLFSKLIFEFLGVKVGIIDQPVMESMVIF